MCVCVRGYIHIHKTRSPFSSPTLARAHHIWAKWKRGGMWFSYMKHIRTHTDEQREHVNERERHKSISHFPPHSIDVWMCMLLFLCSCCYFVLLLCVPRFSFFFLSAFFRHTLASGESSSSSSQKKIKHTKIIKEIYRARFAIFSFLAARQTRMWNNICVYTCLLAVYCFFPFRFRRCLLFFGERKRIARHVSHIFRLKMYGSIVLGALEDFF